MFSVNGGACGAGSSYNPTPHYGGSCAGGGAVTPSYLSPYCSCGGGIPNSIPSWDGYGKQYEWAKDFSDNFANHACAATSLLNELSEQYTKETGKVLTKEQRYEAIKKAYDSGNLREEDAHVNNWTEAANDMASALGLKGKYQYVQYSSKPSAKIYAWDKDGDGCSDHFVNDIGDGYYYDPATGKTGRVDTLQLATKDNLGKWRSLEYN